MVDGDEWEPIPSKAMEEPVVTIDGSKMNQSVEVTGCKHCLFNRSFTGHGGGGDFCTSPVGAPEGYESMLKKETTGPYGPYGKHRGMVHTFLTPDWCPLRKGPIQITLNPKGDALEATERAIQMTESAIIKSPESDSLRLSLVSLAKRKEKLEGGGK